MENVISMAGTDRGEALVAECQRHTQARARFFSAEHASCRFLEPVGGKLSPVCLADDMSKPWARGTAQDELECDKAVTTKRSVIPGNGVEQLPVMGIRPSNACSIS